MTQKQSGHAGGTENNAFSNRAEAFMAFVTDPNGGQSRTRTRFVLKGKENVGLADKLTGNGLR